ncbi:MAG: SDR family oxidoreductase [Anaerolineaceae bacterium]|jgi:NAD(P)-dependent dehydrogenase (short-subunit alcohol dehydrogenase family)
MEKYPNLSGKTVLITGATDGIGKELGKIFAHSGAKLLLHGRNPQRLSAAVEEIAKDSGNKDITPVLADFSSLSQVRAMAEQVSGITNKLDLLINNAGLYPDRKIITEDGFEQTLQVNYLAPFLLTISLIPVLTGKTPSRVVNLSSIGHRLVWSNIRDPKMKFFWRWVAYCRSKLLIIPATRELAEQLADTNITVNCIHPGIIRTKLIRMLPLSWGSSVHEGAKTVFNLAINPEFDQISGEYLEKEKIVQASAIARSHRLQKSLWRVSLRWAGLTIPKAVIKPK